VLQGAHIVDADIPPGPALLGGPRFHHQNVGVLR
jgi:hypothetical protein